MWLAPSKQRTSTPLRASTWPSSNTILEINCLQIPSVFLATIRFFYCIWYEHMLLEGSSLTGYNAGSIGEYVSHSKGSECLHIRIKQPNCITHPTTERCIPKTWIYSNNADRNLNLANNYLKVSTPFNARIGRSYDVPFAKTTGMFPYKYLKYLIKLIQWL